MGTKFRGTEIKIADDDEILLKGPHVFLGYFKDQKATDETLIDGWLHTGDCGKVDEDGFLRITGRKKEIIVTSGGKNITPANIEKKINDHGMISQSVVIGDARKFLSALITLDPDKKTEWCKTHGVDEATAHEDPKLIAEIQAHMDEVVNPSFARVEHIRKFSVLPREFSIEDEELTPTMKIKRRIVNKNWGGTVDAMYE